jgi:hypothetical protein
MSSPSNLYAEKIFAEHPTALWALDDKADYVSLVSEEERDLSLWDVSGGTSEIITTINNEPFTDSLVNRISGDLPVDEIGTISCISDLAINRTSLNTETNTISIGFYLYSFTVYVDSIELGYQYQDPDTLENVINTKTVNFPINNNWVFLSETFSLPAIDVDFNLVIKINYNYPGLEMPDEGFIFLINGLSVGQSSEEFQATSLGVELQTIPENIAIQNTQAIEAKAYGLQDLSGYYLGNGPTIFAKNSGMPMVYGSSNITKILPNNDQPSFIIPGTGFLNKAGQYREYTFETWLRIMPDTTGLKKIFGPISSQDGIYIDGPFILIKVGSYVGSHFVGEWFRPMLIQFEVINNSASLLLNGEQVISMDILTSELDFPDPINQDGEEQDWLGFYSYDDISYFEIDCPAIYNYQASTIVAKRRFVYGQGVDFPESINSAYNGETVFIDYPFANYSNNYIYPDIGRWKQGIVENLSIENNNLSVPDYQTPEIQITGRTTTQLFEALNEVQEDELFISLKPNEEWDDINSHIVFNNLNVLNQPIKSFYQVFEISYFSEDERVLFELVNEQTNNRLKASITNGVISYSFKFSGEESIVFSYGGYELNEKHLIGIDLETASKYFGGNLSAFLGSPNQLKLYIGGDKDLTNTFDEKIYRVGFSTKRNYRLFSGFFREDGFSDHSQDGGGFNKTASYTLIPKNDSNSFRLDIATESYWEDYIPLTYFAKYVNDVRGDSYYSLDFIQLNINYPTPNKYLTVGGKDYFDTSSSILKTYLTFQYLESGANKNINSFNTTVLPSKEGVIEPSGNWIDTKYEFVNNMIVYPPTGVDFNALAIVIHFEFLVDGIINKPIIIKSLQLAAQAYSESSPNNIGTRFGLPIFPYKKSGVYFDYKAKNPYTIYKGSSPYLYLTRTSGIELKGSNNIYSNRGLSMPINKNLSNDYKIVAFQASMMFPHKTFNDQATEIFELQGRLDYIKFFAEPIDDTKTRAKIYAVNATTGKLQNGINFYWNGRLTKNPIVTAQEWGILGIGFANSFNLDSYVGAFRITSPFLVNSVSNYKSTGLQQAQQISRRFWLNIKFFVPGEELSWDFWAQSFLWEGLLVVSSENIYGVSPQTIYNSYMGTNKVIVDDDRPMTLNDYSYSVYKDVEWRSITITPV